MVKSKDSNSKLNILITGGSGFLGKAIVDELLDQNSPVDVKEIRILDMNEYSGTIDKRIRLVKGNISKYENVHEACKEIDIVIHTAAIVDWGTKSGKEVYNTNFGGTENVIKACRKNNVSMLVYTSSLDTVISGKPLVDIDENQPYPAKHPNMYCQSKCLAEKLVIKENSKDFKTCVLRPSDIYGEGDPYHIPPLINMAKGGFYTRIGNGSAKSQHVYVRNIAWAHVLAAKALVENNTKIQGNAYFITDGPGSNFFTFFDKIVVEAGYKIWPKNFWMPRSLAYFLGIISEYIAILVRPVKYYNPKLSRFAVMYTCTNFTFNSDKANRDFGFVPKYSNQTALENTIKFFIK